MDLATSQLDSTLRVEFLIKQRYRMGMVVQNMAHYFDPDICLASFNVFSQADV